MQLVITNKNYSSWSLRAWLALRQMGLRFDERRIPMGPDFASEVGALGVAGRVPVLLYQGMAVWDSLAICEYASEALASGRGWPQDPRSRARVRSIAAEIHSGFPAMRQEWPFNLRRQASAPPSPAILQELERLKVILKLREGPFLVGEFCIADAFVAATLLRLRSYGHCPDLEYLEQLLSLQALQEWIRAALAESEVIAKYEVG